MKKKHTELVKENEEVNPFGDLITKTALHAVSFVTHSMAEYLAKLNVPEAAAGMVMTFACAYMAERDRIVVESIALKQHTASWQKIVDAAVATARAGNIVKNARKMRENLCAEEGD